MRSYTQTLKISKNNLAENPSERVSSNILGKVEGIGSEISEKPLISLIIPVLQEEKLLEGNLKIYTEELRKKYNFELIISDGGSTDRTVEIAKKYADKVVVHNLESRQTIAEGRNKGAEVAQGDVFVFINGDTIPEDTNTFFEMIFQWSDGKSIYKDCNALTCNVTIPLAEMLLKDKIFYFCHNRYVRFLNFIGFGMGRGECQIVRKECFNQIGGYDDELAAGEDFDLFRRIAKIGKIGFVKDINVFESPRRFRKFGYIRIIFSWAFNSLFVMFYGRSVSDDWEPVR